MYSYRNWNKKPLCVCFPSADPQGERETGDLITVIFGLKYKKESPRIDVASEPYPSRWTHQYADLLSGGD